MKQSVYRGWAAVIAVGCLMWLLNAWTPLHRDDYDYALIWGTAVPIAGWSDIWQSLYLHYFQHGGRMVAFLFWIRFCGGASPTSISPMPSCSYSSYWHCTGTPAAELPVGSKERYS